MNLSIITVVKDDFENLKNTVKTVERFVKGDYEHIIIVSARSQDLQKYRNLKVSHNTFIHFEDDDGIFDAMNRGKSLATGKFLWFLNAGDYLSQQLIANDINEFCFIKVCYFDPLGKLKFVKLKNNISKGIPYCHQGLIYPNQPIQYDDTFRYGADYIFTLWFVKRYGMPKQLSSGNVFYDTTGISARNRSVSDRYSAGIIYSQFGALPFIAFVFKSKIKLMIKFFIYIFRRKSRIGV